MRPMRLLVLLVLLALALIAQPALADCSKKSTIQVCLEFPSPMPGAQSLRMQLKTELGQADEKCLPNVATVVGTAFATNTANPPLKLNYTLHGAVRMEGSTGYSYYILQGQGRSADKAHYSCAMLLEVPPGKQKGHCRYSYSKEGGKAYVLEGPLMRIDCPKHK